MRAKSAPDVQQRLNQIIVKLKDDFTHIRAENIVCMRSTGAKARAYARIWSMPRIWQSALGMEPHYVIEVLSQHFDAQSKEDQDRTLIHELMHIPKTFSGAVKPHKCNGSRIDKHSVEVYYRKLHDIKEKKVFGLF
jgi:predicted metallopeptidase